MKILDKLYKNLDSYVSFIIYNEDDVTDMYHNKDVFKIDMFKDTNDYILYQDDDIIKYRDFIVTPNYLLVKYTDPDNDSYDIAYIRQSHCFHMDGLAESIKSIMDIINIVANFKKFYKTRNEIIFGNGLKNIKYSANYDYFMIKYNDKNYLYYLSKIDSFGDLYCLYNFLFKLIRINIMCYICNTESINNFSRLISENSGIISYDLLNENYKNNKYIFCYDLLEQDLYYKNYKLIDDPIIYVYHGNIVYNDNIMFTFY